MSQLDERYGLLIGRISAGDVAALKEFYDSTASRMLAYAERFVRNRETAEEVLQEAYLAAWRLSPTYSAAVSPPTGWLAMIVRTKSLNALRDRRRNHGDASHGAGEQIQDRWEGENSGPMDLVAASQQAVALSLCLRKIRLQYRQALTLAYFDDLTHREIAARLDVPHGTVKGWIRRGLSQIRSCMNELQPQARAAAKRLSR